MRVYSCIFSLLLAMCYLDFHALIIVFLYILYASLYAPMLAENSKLRYCILVFYSLQPWGHLLGKGRPIGSLVFAVFLCFCHFPIRCPGSGVVFDCIDP